MSDVQGSSSELEMQMGAHTTPQKVEIENRFPSGIWKILLGVGGGGWGEWCCMKEATQRVSSRDWELERSSLCLPALTCAAVRHPSPTTTLAPSS